MFNFPIIIIVSVLILLFIKFIQQSISARQISFTYAPISSWFINAPSLKTIIFLGLVLRFMIIILPAVNFDMSMFMTYADVFREGKRNIFMYNYSYNYSAAIFFLVGFFDTIFQFLKLPFYPPVHRTFITLIDLLTLFILIKIAKKYNISEKRTAVFYFLNPVSILLSGYHSHFDNIPVFFLLFGTWYYFCSNLPYKKVMAWALISLGFIVKHIIPFQVLLVYAFWYQRRYIYKAFILFGLTVIAFLATFIPFYTTDEAKFVINEYVFGYQGLATISGFTAIMYRLCPNCEFLEIKYYTLYKYLFMGAGIIFALYLTQLKDVFRALLLSLIFFVAFTSGHAAQYFILPIAVGALYPSIWFVLYTLVTTLFLTIFQIEIGISIYIKVILMNVSWLIALCWFASEFMKLFPFSKKMYNVVFDWIRK